MIAHRCDVGDGTVVAVHNLDDSDAEVEPSLEGMDSSYVLVDLLAEGTTEVSDSGRVTVKPGPYDGRWLRARREGEIVGWAAWRKSDGQPEASVLVQLVGEAGEVEGEIGSMVTPGPAGALLNLRQAIQQRVAVDVQCPGGAYQVEPAPAPGHEGGSQLAPVRLGLQVACHGRHQPRPDPVAGRRERLMGARGRLWSPPPVAPGDAYAGVGPRDTGGSQWAGTTSNVCPFAYLPTRR